MSFDFNVVYDLVNEVPKGEVASYGMIASLLPGVTARMVGRALSQMPAEMKTPWHRIVQSSGAIAPRDGAQKQRDLLAAEGVVFRQNGGIDWKNHRWRGPSQKWVAKSGMDPVEVMEIISGWRR